MVFSVVNHSTVDVREEDYRHSRIESRQRSESVKLNLRGLLVVFNHQSALLNTITKYTFMNVLHTWWVGTAQKPIACWWRLRNVETVVVSATSITLTVLLQLEIPGRFA